MKSLTLSSIALAIIFTALFSSEAKAQYSSYWRWDHKFGSDIVGLVANGSNRSFVMLKNDSGISNWNLNQTVFSGRKQGNCYVGSFQDYYSIHSTGDIASNGLGVTFWVGEGRVEGQNKFTFISRTAPAYLREPSDCDTGLEPGYSSYWNYRGEKLGLIASGNQRQLINLSNGATVFSGVKSGSQYRGQLLQSNGYTSYCVANICNNGQSINFNGSFATYSHR